ncbi:MAG: site-specific integrase [Thermoproteota archaeon]|nr:site-specific integrase [Thermoproteota archaeon]
MQKYIDFAGTDDIFYGNNPRLIERKIINYIEFLKKEGKTASRINVYVIPVKSFYTINDVILNVRKIGKFLPENRKVRQGKAYTHSEIGKMLEIADERIRAVICILSSTGIRLGALPELRLRHLEDTKFTIYEGTKEEYITFCTPECKKAIDDYLDMRSRYREKLKDESYLIREQFDLRNPGKPRPMQRRTIQWKIYDLCKRAGIDKSNISVIHGFRKFFTTQCVNSKINPEIREMLLGHKIGLASSYYRPTEEEMLEEYKKAVNNLTINEVNRLKIKVQKLEVEKSRIDKLEENFRLLQSKLK